MENASCPNEIVQQPENIICKCGKGNCAEFHPVVEAGTWIQLNYSEWRARRASNLTNSASESTCIFSIT